MRPKELTDNIFELIDDEWMLITAKKDKTDGKYNTMTASWGGVGIMWGKPVAWCVIRPVRYTYEFMEEADYFTLSFFSRDYRKALNILGTKSGRNTKKIEESGLTAFDFSEVDKTEEVKNKIISFKEANIIITCKKVYYQDINPSNFKDGNMDKSNYPNKDYHRMYFGEITGCHIK
ncbi:MAG: flavin reductase [Oscillospiraceae bacterium]|nr:flavin reductase [Oscillospiraceae bacterium]